MTVEEKQESLLAWASKEESVSRRERSLYWVLRGQALRNPADGLRVLAVPRLPSETLLCPPESSLCSPVTAGTWSKPPSCLDLYKLPHCLPPPFVRYNLSSWGHIRASLLTCHQRLCYDNIQTPPMVCKALLLPLAPFCLPLLQPTTF